MSGRLDQIATEVMAAFNAFSVEGDRLENDGLPPLYEGTQLGALKADLEAVREKHAPYLVAFCDAYLRLTGQVQALGASQGRSPWIPVAQRLPDAETRVLLLAKGEIVVGHLAASLSAVDPDFWAAEGDVFEWPDVTHWMPLPEAPQ